MDYKINKSNSFGESPNINSYSTQEVIEDFLKSISKSDLNCFAVKGCMALNNHFINKRLPFARMTQDLDLHCYSRENWENFVEESSKIATLNSKIGATYKLISRRGFDKNPNGDSLKYQASFVKGGTIDFKVDMNFGSDVDIISYDDCISFYSIPVILSDKLTVLATRKICRRIKDLIDIYLICSNFDLQYLEICSKIKNRLDSTNRSIDLNNLYFLNDGSIEEMKHAFSKYDQSVKMDVSFEELFYKVLDFVSPIYLYLNDNIKVIDFWDSKKGEWL